MSPENAFSRPNQVEATFGESFDKGELGPIPEDFEEAMAAIMNIEVKSAAGSSESSEAEPDRLEKLQAAIEQLITTVERATGHTTNRSFFNDTLCPALRTKITELVDAGNDSRYTETVVELPTEQVTVAQERPGDYGDLGLPDFLKQLAKEVLERTNTQRRKEALDGINNV